MTMERETQNEENVNCAIGSMQYYFVGLENCEVLVFLSYGHNLVRKIQTKRAPISMCLLDSRLVVVGLKNHAFTVINYKDHNFKQVGMTWNSGGNDWSQVFTNRQNNGFFRVWQYGNMAFAKLGKQSKNPLSSVEIEWQTEHVVKKDMHIYGEIDDRQLLFYSFGDSQF